MPQFLLSVHAIEGDPPPAPEVMEQAIAAGEVFNQELKEQGAWVFAGGLNPPSSASVVRVQGGDVLTVDGPFAETKEQLAGIWIIRAAHLDDALAWAAKATRACWGPVEVRPFQEGPEG